MDGSVSKETPPAAYISGPLPLTRENLDSVGAFIKAQNDAFRAVYPMGSRKQGEDEEWFRHTTRINYLSKELERMHERGNGFCHFARQTEGGPIIGIHVFWPEHVVPEQDVLDATQLLAVAWPETGKGVGVGLVRASLKALRDLHVHKYTSDTTAQVLGIYEKLHVAYEPIAGTEHSYIVTVPEQQI